jgi:glycosyltransferase involved in cell wall biosynthesis
MKRAIILSYSRFPEGDAGAVRQAAMAMLMKEMEYEVFIIGMGPSEYMEIKYFQDIAFTSLRISGNSTRIKLTNYFGYRSRLKRFLINCPTYDIILVVDLPLDAMRFVRNYAQKTGAILLHDSVEWYSPEQFRYGKWSLEYLKKDWLNRRFFDARWHVIAISTFLDKYFLSKGLNTVRIPAIMDIQQIMHEKHTEKDYIMIQYGGDPGKKDYLDQFLQALSMLSDKELARIRVRFFGVTEKQIIDLTGVVEQQWNRIKHYIDCRGRESRNEILLGLLTADFSILIRSPEQRYAKAGFPTKVVESLAAGTPVICNLTSDLGMYLHDGKETLIVNDCTALTVCAALKRAISLSFEEKQKMYEASRRCAEENFDYRDYVNALKVLL